MEISESIRRSYRGGQACSLRDVCPVLLAGQECVVALGESCSNTDRGFSEEVVRVVLAEQSR